MILGLWLATSSGSAAAEGLFVGADKRATPLSEGDRAPYDGQLLTPALAAELGTKAERCDRAAQLELEAERELCRIKVDGAAAVRGILLERHRDEVHKLEEALERLAADEAEARALADRAERDRWVWGGIGAGGGAVLGIVVAVLVGAGAVWAAGQLADVVVARGGT